MSRESACLNSSEAPHVHSQLGTIKFFYGNRPIVATVQAMRVTPLNQNWTFRSFEKQIDYPRNFVPKVDWLPATVPGYVHLDLQANGIIPNPTKNCYEQGCAWIDQTEWAYRLTFEAHPVASLPKRVLRFEGLDTLCDILFNGQPVGSFENMFLPHEIDVSKTVKRGTNELILRFRPASAMGEERRKAYFEQEDLPPDQPLFEARAFVRKAQYMFGWDWGPRLISCGIWKGVSLLEYRSRIIRASLRQEKVSKGKFRLWADMDVEGDGVPTLHFGKRQVLAGADVEVRPQLWWPNGEGVQRLYNAALSMGDHQIEKHIGFRTIELTQEADKNGKSFAFIVNGRPIWMRGANWIPHDSFPLEGPSVIEQVETCRRLGMNMLRVWGGGLYESESFYDSCDRSGILVWQDFPYACSYYPDGPNEQAIAAEEAAEQIWRLRGRTCLALWCGNNENSAMHEQNWAGKGKQPPRLYGENLYTKTLPRVLAELDPQHSYIPTSPLQPLKDNHGDAHYWEVWHGRGDWKNYEDAKCRFVSEFGFASSPSMPCWRGAGASEEWTLDARPVRWHDRTGKPREVFEGFVELHYPKSETLEDWAYYSQLNQRDALRCAIEHFRFDEACRGALIWQFNDCWPAQSWAVQDHKRVLKPAGFELARLYAPVLIRIRVEGDHVIAQAANHGESTLAGELTLELISTEDGSVRTAARQHVRLWPDSIGKPLRLSIRNLDRTRMVARACVVEHPATETWRLLCEPKELAANTAKVKFAFRAAGVRVEVRGFVADLVVIDPDDPFNVFDLRTGQSGLQSVTIADSAVVMGLRHRPRRLVARSLAGETSWEAKKGLNMA